MGVLVISDESKLEGYRAAFGRGGYLTDRFSDIEKALEFARESIEESKKPGIKTKSIDFCFIDIENGIDIREKLLEVLKQQDLMYIVNGGQVKLCGGKTDSGVYNINGTEKRDIVRVVLDDREDLIKLDGRLGGKGKFLRDEGDKRYQGLKTENEDKGKTGNEDIGCR